MTPPTEPTAAGSSPREHWRSLEQLAGTPEARAFEEREFPVGASELPEGINRRELVQLLGASMALAGLTACRRPVENIVPFVTPPEELVPGVPKRYATTMPFGIGGYGLLVESHEGRPTKIEGNELHPATAGTRQRPDAGRHPRASTTPTAPQHPLQRSAPRRGRRAGLGRFRGGLEVPRGRLPGRGRRRAGRARPGRGLADALPARGRPAPALPEAALGDLGAGERRERARRRRPCRPAGRCVPSYDLGAARVILSLDADLLLSESGAVAHARGFAAGRRLASEKEAMNRLWVAESAFTTTGAMADHRLPLPSGRIGALALALGRALGLPEAAGAGEVPGVPQKWIAALAQDLKANAGHGLVVAGRDQPPAVHALALAINAALGNVGTTVTAARAGRRAGGEHAGAGGADRGDAPGARCRPSSSWAATRSTTRPPTWRSPPPWPRWATSSTSASRRTRPRRRRTGTSPRPISSKPGAIAGRRTAPRASSSL